MMMVACTGSLPRTTRWTRSSRPPGKSAYLACTIEPAKGYFVTFWQRFRPLWVRLLALLAVVGPGIITANVDNDAGGITTYSLAGAQFGYSLLWTLIPITVALVVVQEMCARMGAITGKGLADLIREQYGVKVTFYVMVALLFANLANTVAEF